MRTVLLALALMGSSCGAPRRPLPERLFRVGVDPTVEARAVIASLERAGYATAQRIDGDGFVALAFARAADDRRAVRIVTRLGVRVALDSHETDGVRVRHGAVRLVELARHDVDGDGAPEIVVAREAPGGDCIAVVRIRSDGHARAATMDEVAPGTCASRLEDVDGDGRLEAIVELSWPDLSLAGEVPRVRVALVAERGGWRAGAAPVAFEERERASRIEALEAARARLDVASAHRLGVELAALARLSGASTFAQVQRYDEALSGLVLHSRDRDRVTEVRAFLAAGWGAPTP